MSLFGLPMIFVLLGLAISYIVYGMKKLHAMRTNGQDRKWYQQFYVLLGGTWFTVALLSISLFINESVHNEISNIALLIVMTVFVIALSVLLVLIYRSRRYFQQ